LAHSTRRVASTLSTHFFLSHNTATSAIYTLSLHDALPIWRDDPERARACGAVRRFAGHRAQGARRARRRQSCRPPSGQGNVCREDRKSTRLNSSHLGISYAVFCLKKKKQKTEAKQRVIEQL